MSQLFEYLDFPPLGAETSFSFNDVVDWSISNDDMVLNDGLLISLPLSEIQPELKIFNSQGVLVENDAEASDSLNSPFNLKSESVKEEDFSSPPFSPLEAPSGSASPNDIHARAQIASKLLDDLDIQKEEPLSNWFEEKINLPIFEEVPSPRGPDQDVQSLWMEFNGVLDNFSQQNNAPQLTHLTPPQSPPENQYQFVSQNEQQLLNAATYEWQPDIVDSSDIDKELAIVDNLVLTNAQNFEQQYIVPSSENINYAANYTIIEPSKEHVEDTASLSPSSPSSSSCSTFGSSENDDEWSYPLSSFKNSKSRNARSSKPYSRSPDDKKSRKKEQNKNAATRYRQKKKAEIEILMDEEKELRGKNNDLMKKYVDVRREVSYLKNLIRDLYKVKGLVK